MRGFTLVLCFVATTAAAQEPVPTTSESTRAEPIAPAPPTREQLRYLEGLRTAGRGVAQLKAGLSRVTGGHGDASRRKQAARRLAGLCGTARGFMTSGRAKMEPKAYEDSARIRARRLTTQVDSLIRAAPACELNAARQPDSTVAGLLSRLKTYDAALKEFRAATGQPNR